LQHSPSPNIPSTAVDVDLGLRLLRTMRRIRAFEEGIEALFLAGRVPGFVHLSIGQEAVAAGVCGVLRPTDYIASTHRGHGHTLAKGSPMDRMTAELMGRSTGLCKGKGGSMHVADFSCGMLGANGVVAGGFGLVAGAALSQKVLGKDGVAVCFFGDGATNRGPFHENLNLSAVWNLPAIFVLEANAYASTTPTRETTKIEHLAVRADAYGIPYEIADGFDAFAVLAATQRAVERARAGGGPTFLEFDTYRMRGHYVGDPERYRERAEVNAHKSDDPIVRMEAVLAEHGVDRAALERVALEAAEEFEAAVAFAEASPFPDPSEALVGALARDREIPNDRGWDA